VDGGVPSHNTIRLPKGKFWGAAKFAFRPMTQNIYGEPAEPSKMPQGRFWLKKHDFVV